MTNECVFVTTIKKVGNSNWVLVPYTQMQMMGIKAGDAVKVTIQRAEE